MMHPRILLLIVWLLLANSLLWANGIERMIVVVEGMT